MPRLLLLFIFQFSCHLLFSQADTRFWFVAPDVDQNAGEFPISLVISSLGERSTVKISQPANPAFQPIIESLFPGEIEDVDLTNFLDQVENKPANLVLSKGILIESDKPIGAYYYVSHPEHQEIFTLKGEQALGLAFLIPSQTDFRNSIGRSAFDIVATEDSTLISIVPSQAITGHPAGQSFTVQLGRGETFSCRADGGDGIDHLAGSRIQANKPIAVTISDNAIANDLGRGNDLLGDQLLPVEAAGKEYIAMRTEGETERLYVLATESSTNISVNGIPISQNSLNEGEQIAVELNGMSTYIKADHPVLVYQLNGFKGEVGGAMLNPLDCGGIRKIKYIRPSSQNFFTYLLTRKGMQDGFRLNGASNIVPEFFDEVPGTNGAWVSTRIEVKASFVVSHNEISNIKGPFQMGMLVVRDNSSSYAHFSGPLSSDLVDSVFVCEGNPAFLNANPDLSNFVWSTGETTSSIIATEDGTYTLRVEETGCVLEDTVFVKTIGEKPDLGEDDSLCPGDTLSFEESDVFEQYIWSTGETSPAISINKSGSYIISASKGDCTLEDTVNISIPEIPPLSLGQDTFICPNSSLLLDIGISNASYKWQNGSQRSTFEVVEAGQISVQRLIENCVQADTLEVFLKSLSLPSPVDTSICVGDTLSIGIAMEDSDLFWEDGLNVGDRQVSNPGIYTLIATNECETAMTSWNIQVEDCNCSVFLPNAFSPNGDGINDQFRAEPDCLLEQFQLRIYDRWGREVFISNAVNNSWSNMNAKPGVYYWQLQYKGELDRRGLVRKHGNVLLVR